MLAQAVVLLILAIGERYTGSSQSKDDPIEPIVQLLAPFRRISLHLMAKQQHPAKGWLGSTEAARALGVTPRTLYRLIDSGGLPAYRFGRLIRLRQPELDEFVQRSRITPIRAT